MIDQLLSKMDGAYADNTIKAYRTDFDVFSSWCQRNGYFSLPASPDTVSQFIEFDMQNSSASTIRRRMASIRKIHKLARMPDPTLDEDVLLSLRRMHRQKGRWQRQAFAMTREIRDQLLSITDESLKGLRDKALLYLAYDSMRRRSELCDCEWSDITFNNDGSGSWFLQFSKSDQEGYGKHISLSSDTINALIEWKHKANLKSGKVLRGFIRQEIIGSSLNPNHIARIFKKLAKKAKLDSNTIRNISGHSARVGHAQDLVSEGKTLPQIMIAGGWKSPSIVMRYIENTDFRFEQLK